MKHAYISLNSPNRKSEITGAILNEGFLCITANVNDDLMQVASLELEKGVATVKLYDHKTGDVIAENAFSVG